MDASNLPALKAEIASDPLRRGYAEMKTDDIIADAINRPDRQPHRDVITSGFIAAAVVKSEFTTLAPTDKVYLQWLTACAGEMPLTANLRTELAGLFPNGTQTRANIAAALKRSGSRGDELGIGFVTPSDVANAKRA